jgi:carbonic anhydrase
MKDLPHILAQNRKWSEAIRERDPDHFKTLSRLQQPDYLWIGCADSRVPANEIVGMKPGELFVHRNIANVVVHSDLNCLSVLQYAVDVLRVSHVIVCGHYGCGGVSAVAREERIGGLADNWLRHIHDIKHKHIELLNQVPHDQVTDRLCELNVIEQAMNVCKTTTLQDAWARYKDLTVHAWIYGLADGLIRDLGFCVSSADEAGPAYQKAVGDIRIGIDRGTR